MKTKRTKSVPIEPKYVIIHSGKIFEERLEKDFDSRIYGVHFGNVYVIGPDKGPYKIGYTKAFNFDAETAVKRRLESFQIGTWQELKIHYISGNVRSAKVVECMVHQILRKKHVRGEWFKYDLDTIKDVVEQVAKINNSLV